MKKIYFLFICLATSLNVTYAQTAAKAAYAEIGGPGLASANFDMRLKKQEDGLGFRVGVGGFSINDGGGGKAGIITIPVGLNYLLGKDGKNYFELGAGFTYINLSSKDDFGSENFNSSFGNLTLGYRHAPENGGFFFKAEITPVFGKGFFIPYFAGLGFGYKF
ncbi:MAG: hypothetical protein ABI594_17750 [Ginsengibacter sp.]